MLNSAIARKIDDSSAVHIALLTEFITITEERALSQPDGFTRESLGDLLVTLREQRDTYLEPVVGLSPRVA